MIPKCVAMWSDKWQLQYSTKLISKEKRLPVSGKLKMENSALINGSGY